MTVKVITNLRESKCPRPIKAAQSDTTKWCIENGHCGCCNKLLSVRHNKKFIKPPLNNR